MQNLHEILFSGEELSCYAVLNAAINDDLLDHLYDEEAPVAFECLYRGELPPEVAYVAPYLVGLERDTAFGNWLVSGIGKNWGIFALVPASLEMSTVRRHFRKFNLIEMPNGKEVMFLYYDPRILNKFIRIMTPEQLNQFFGPIRYIIADEEGAGAVFRYSLNPSGTLEIETLKLALTN